MSKNVVNFSYFTSCMTFASAALIRLFWHKVPTSEQQASCFIILRSYTDD